MASNVVGLFDDRDEAHAAIQDLMAAGYGHDRMSIVATDPDGEFHRYHPGGNLNLAKEGADTGMTSGALVGALVGLLIGSGAIFLAPAGLLVAGPLAGLLAGATAGMATGGVVGGLIGLGIPEDHAHTYAESVHRGGTLISVTCDTAEVEKVKTILDRDGAVDIEERTAIYRREGSKDAESERIQLERDQLRAMASDDTIGSSLGSASLEPKPERVRAYAYADLPTGKPNKPESN